MSKLNDKNKESAESDESEFVSKTQLKREAKDLQDFGKKLVELSDVQIEQLPLENVTKNALFDFKKQQGNIAKKRHLAFIGKCLRKDDAQSAMEFLEEDNLANLRKANSEPKRNSESALEKLIANGEDEIQSIIENNAQIERQTLRQLLRNFKSAKTDAKKATAKSKLERYLKDNNVQ